MENVFIQTENVTRFNDACTDLSDPMSRIGPSLAMVTGPAGRGKSEASKHYAAQSDAVYIPPMNKTSPLMLLREITFELCMLKPGRIEGCLDIIGSEMARERRVIIIDEADLLPFTILEMLRNVNERYACPVVLIGEEDLKGKIGSRRRLNSRVRRRVEFSQVKQPDIALFFKKAMGVEITPEVAAVIRKYSRGDWRPVLTMAADIEKAMKASNISDIPMEMVKGIIKSYG